MKLARYIDALQKMYIKYGDCDCLEVTTYTYTGREESDGVPLPYFSEAHNGVVLHEVEDDITPSRCC